MIYLEAYLLMGRLDRLGHSQGEIAARQQGKRNGELHGEMLWCGPLEELGALTPFSHQTQH